MEVYPSLANINNSLSSQRTTHYSISSKMASEGKDINRVAGGLKAAIHNPHVSDAAKADAEQRLDQIEHRAEDTDNAHHNHVMAGYKAALKNPNVSEEAKEHAAQVLREDGA